MNEVPYRKKLAVVKAGLADLNGRFAREKGRVNPKFKIIVESLYGWMENEVTLWGHMDTEPEPPEPEGKMVA